MHVHNALASRVIIDQLTSLLRKVREEVNAWVKCLPAMLDASPMMYPPLHRGDGSRGQDPDHSQSPRGDSASSISLSLDERV
jgi:hypothetical protein